MSKQLKLCKNSAPTYVFWVLLGCIHQTGITVYDYEESHVKRAMIAAAASVAALASSEKIGTVAPYVVGKIDELTHLITDAFVSEQLLVPYEAVGLTILRE